MTHRVALLLAPGFEEAEAFMALDVLERLNISVIKIACHTEKTVTSYHNIKVIIDDLLCEKMDVLFDAVVIPGGPLGTDNLTANEDVIEFIRRHDQAGKWICPICSAAAKVLGRHGLLKGRRYVCSGDLYQSVTDGEYVDAAVVEDGNLLSGKGLGLVFDFAFNVAHKLTGDTEQVRFHADHIYHQLTLLGDEA
ncbi:DJ-1/PfpI family protein [Vibrio tritonius]|uniref:DJ-1/PfpI family protein n=1 Tax=Vibrio tritonius TaxID=1435069 RepID=UPI00315D51A8